MHTLYTEMHKKKPHNFNFSQFTFFQINFKIRQDKEYQVIERTNEEYFK